MTLKEKLEEAVMALEIIRDWPNHAIENSSQIMSSMAKQTLQYLEDK